MSDELIRCPEDPELDYFRCYCETVFRNSRYHYWCRRCRHFVPPTNEQPAALEPEREDPASVQ
jgi:hypothetical protein